MERIVRVHGDHDSDLNEIFTACDTAVSAADLVNDIFPPIQRWLGVDILAITMVEDRSILVASQRNIDPILQQKLCVHSARCIGIEAKRHMTRHCGLDLIWVGHTPSSASGRIDSGAQILWTGSIQENGWLKGLVTVYREKIAPLSHRQNLGLKSLTRKLRDTLSRLEDARGNRMALRDRAIPRPQVTVLRLRESEFILRCFGLDVARALQQEVTSLLLSQIPGIADIRRLGCDRILLRLQEGQTNVSSETWQKFLADARRVTTRCGIPLDLEVEETHPMPLEVQMPERSNETTQLIPPVEMDLVKTLAG